MKKMVWLIIALSFNFYTDVFAETPTIIEAEANTPDGGRNISIVEQSADSNNPLGNPIVGPYVPPKAYNSANAISTNSYGRVQDSSVDGVSQSDNVANQALQLGNDFENTLIEANGRIYSTQSYPLKDINIIGNKAIPQTIYSPNVNQ